MNKKISIILFLVINCFLPQAIWAISPTPTPNNNIKEIRDKVKEKVLEKIQEAKLGQKRAFSGEISEIANSIITLTTLLGDEQIKVASDTAVVGSGAKKIEIKDLELGSFVIAMGYLDENNILETRRLVVTAKSSLPAREVVHGRVTDISAEEKMLTVKYEKKGITYTVIITNKTIITKKQNERIEKVPFSAIKVDDVIVAVGTSTENEKKIITAKIIHVIPGLSKPTTTPKPTVSPKPTASPTPQE